jgi:hypothetical protein
MSIVIRLDGQIAVCRIWVVSIVGQKNLHLRPILGDRCTIPFRVEPYYVFQTAGQNFVTCLGEGYLEVCHVISFAGFFSQLSLFLSTKLSIAPILRAEG